MRKSSTFGVKTKIIIIFLAVFLSVFLFINNSKADEACAGEPDGMSCYLSNMGTQLGKCQGGACVASTAANTANATNATTGASSSGGGVIPCGGPNNPCTICYMVLGIQNIINFGFKIFVGIGILMVVIAGIAYIISAGNSGMMETAKGFLKNALIGFAVILGAWVIINTLMIVLGARTNLGITEAGNWYTFKCIQQSQLPSQQKATSGATTNPVSNNSAAANSNSKSNADSNSVEYTGGW